MPLIVAKLAAVLLGMSFNNRGRVWKHLSSLAWVWLFLFPRLDELVKLASESVQIVDLKKGTEKLKTLERLMLIGNYSVGMQAKIMLFRSHLFW